MRLAMLAEVRMRYAYSGLLSYCFIRVKTENRPCIQASTMNNDTDHSKNETLMAKWTRNVGIFTFLLVIVTGISDFVIYQQWRLSNSQMIDTREQLRAFVSGPNFAEVVAKKADGKLRYGFVAQFQNSGGTRTAKFNGWNSIKYFPGEIPNNLDLSKPWMKIDPAEVVIGPNGVAQLSPITIEDDEAHKTLNKEGEVLIWGRAEFADIFQPTVMHPLSFCFLLIPAGTDDRGQITFTPRPYRNECNTSS